MVIVEKSFPRGGTEVKETKRDGNKEKIIFGALQKKLKKPKSKTKVSLDVDEAEKDKIETISAELLSYDAIQDGMNIMGVVKLVDQLLLNISLPGRMVARVSALEISESYTKAAKEFLENSITTDQFKSLVDIYHVGQIVYGRVQEVKKNEHGRTHISLSLKPSEVHAELTHGNVKKGFIFNGAIEEVQEHGYIIESGIKGMRTFVPMEKSEPGRTVGQLIYLKVEKISKDKAVSTCVCKEIKPQNVKIKNQMEANLDYLLPSSIVQFTVTKQLKDGLQGTIMNEAFTAYINEHQLGEPLALPEDYEVNSVLNARILYVMPLTKLVYLSLNLRNSSSGDGAEGAGAGEAPKFKRGDIIERAKVHHLGTGGVILILDNKYKGVISYRTIKMNYKGNYDQDEVLVKYAKKTSHKVRVLDYDLMDSMYICTDDASTVNEKIFALDDLKVGEFLTATVRQENSKVGGYTMQVGRVKGIIEKLYLAPSTKHLEPDAKVRCCVVAISRDRKTVYLTNRPEYMKKNPKVLLSLADAKENSTYTGTIVKICDDYFLVKFFNDVKGILYKSRLNGLTGSDTSTSFYEGQTMEFRVVGKNAEQLTLSLSDETFNLGEICPVTVVHTLESGLEITIAYHEETVGDHGEEPDDAVEMKGLIPIRLLSDHVDLLQAKLRMYPVNTQTEAVCMTRNIFSLRDVQYFMDNITKNLHTVQPGDILKAYVKNVNKDVVDLMLPIRNYGKLVKVHLKMLLVNAFRLDNIELSPEQVVFVKVLSKEQATKTITVSARLTDVWNGDLSGTAQFVESYLNEIAIIKKAFRKQGNPIGQYKLGQKVNATFQGVIAGTNDWQFDVDKTKVAAIVKVSIVGKSKPPSVGAQQECIIIWIDYSNEVLFVSNKSGDITHITTGTEVPSNLVGKSGINAKVILKTESIFVCSLKKGPNPLVICPMRLHFNDFENSAGVGVKEGEFCKLAFIHESKPIAVLESTWKLWQDVKRKRKAEAILEASKPKKGKTSIDMKVDEPAKKKKKNGETLTVGQSKVNKETPQNVVQSTKAEKVKNKKEKAKVEKSKAGDGALFYEDTLPNPSAYIEYKSKSCSVTTNTHPKPVAKNLPGVSDFWTTDLEQLQPTKDLESSSDDDETTDEVPQKKKKLTTAEKFKQQREEEARLRAIEEKYADPNQLPESVDQFDRLVLSDPNNSKHWISYMVYHLQSTEIDKARAVARRAIKAISFRDVNEQLNVWMALLNLELRYGNKETFDDTLKEALTYNDPLKVYLRAVEILSDAKRSQELLEMIGLITKKFKSEQEVWKTAANAYFVIGMPDRAQQMLHKALACLPEREHVNTIVMFANLNHKHGNNEMAQTLLDQVVTSYPKRVDVWTQYVDMLVKENLIDSARSVLERAVIQKIPLKKMRTIFKKYLEFEERFGSELEVQKVKQLAIEYVKKNSHL